MGGVDEFTWTILSPNCTETCSFMNGVKNSVIADGSPWKKKTKQLSAVLSLGPVSGVMGLYPLCRA